MKRVVEAACIVALVVALAYALYTYDLDRDPTFHAHTATCAHQGCTFGQ